MLKLFSTIKAIAECKQSLVIILIDEVESIAYARDLVSSNEPSDSLRVVNAVLTQLDQLRSFPNVLVLTTSNLTSTIDLAFIDRADLKQFVGHPSVEAIYEIFRSAIAELIKVSIISTESTLADYEQMMRVARNGSEWYKHSERLMEIARRCFGFSGRTLRKLPMLAHAWFVTDDQVSLDDFLLALELAVEKNASDSKNIGQ